jgi:hypothetical protein
MTLTAVAARWCHEDDGRAGSVLLLLASLLGLCEIASSMLRKKQLPYW